MAIIMADAPARQPPCYATLVCLALALPRADSLLTTRVPQRACGSRLQPARAKASHLCAATLEDAYPRARRSPAVLMQRRDTPQRHWLRRWAQRALLVSFTLAVPTSVWAAPLDLRSPAIATSWPWSLPVVPASTWTIPLVAGVLNFITNKLAVKMMFYPLRFRGIGRVGWHGIVPAKALPMANDIVDNVMLRLINVSQVFQRLPPEEIARTLDATVLRVGHELAGELFGVGSGRAVWAPAVDVAVRDARFNQTLLAHSRPLLAGLVRDIHANAERVFDLRSLVVKGMTRDSRVLVRLFEKCGERDLRFVVRCTHATHTASPRLPPRHPPPPPACWGHLLLRWQVRSGLFLGGLLGLLQAPPPPPPPPPPLPPPALPRPHLASRFPPAS